MRRSIKRLPKCTQEELTTLLELIKHHVEHCQMVILYGSYARGNYVLWDTKVEFGVRTSYQSDYDILVVVSTPTAKKVVEKLRRVTTKYHKIFEGRRHASPQFIIEHINTINNNLEEGQYFFTDVIKQGIMLYDRGECRLTKSRELSFEEISDIAKSEFNICFPYGERFLKHAYTDFEDEVYNTSAFLIHQACEKFYNTVQLVFTNYRPKNHKINELAGLVKRFSMEFVEVFPQNTDFEKECFNLLCRFYIEARYDKDFKVTREQLEYLLSRAEVLKEMTFRLCMEKIASYDGLIDN